MDELYDINADADELVDVARDTRHGADLERLRGTLRRWMRETKDTGILPEPILRREAHAAGSEWAIFHPKVAADAAAAQTRYDTILAVAWDVAENHDAEHFSERLTDTDPAIRYWAVAGTGWAAKRGGDPAPARKRVATLPKSASRRSSPSINWAMPLEQCGPRLQRLNQARTRNTHAASSNACARNSLLRRHDE